jgi:hypothetical protein
MIKKNENDYGYNLNSGANCYTKSENDNFKEIYFIKSEEIEKHQEILKEGSIYDLESLDFTEERKSLFEKEIFTYENIEKVTAALEYIVELRKKEKESNQSVKILKIYIGECLQPEILRLNNRIMEEIFNNNRKWKIILEMSNIGGESFGESIGYGGPMNESFGYGETNGFGYGETIGYGSIQNFEEINYKNKKVLIEWIKDRFEREESYMINSTVISKLKEIGYYKSMNTKENYNDNDIENVCGYIIGQVIDVIENPSPFLNTASHSIVYACERVLKKWEDISNVQ